MTTYIVQDQNGASTHNTMMNVNSGLPLLRQWEVQRDPTYQAFSDRMKSSQSPFLLPPTVAKEGEFRNVANMTAATAHRQAKAGHGQQQQSVLTPGHTLMIEGVQIELDLNPGGRTAGSGGLAEWVVRMGWLGGAPNPLNANNNQNSTKGIIVEVSHCIHVCRDVGLLKPIHIDRWNTCRCSPCLMTKDSKIRWTSPSSCPRSSPPFSRFNKSLRLRK